MTTPDLEAIEARWPREDEWAPFVEKQAATDIAALIAWGKATEAALHAATQERDQQAARVGDLEAALSEIALLHCGGRGFVTLPVWKGETESRQQPCDTSYCKIARAALPLAAPRVEVE